MPPQNELFDLMQNQITDLAQKHGEKNPQAFIRWFVNLFYSELYLSNSSLKIVDGSGDGKADAFISFIKNGEAKNIVVNAKYTSEYNKASPVSFYEEITAFWQAFENKNCQKEYLGRVRKNIRIDFEHAFKQYKEGKLELLFITNHKINEKQYNALRKINVKMLHMEDLLLYLVENMEGALPETDPLTLCDIATVLTPNKNETEIPTSIVFARLIDFKNYMKNDKYDLLFARNVRLWLGDTPTNEEIKKTYENRPKEFAYSNNGITILCSEHNHNPGTSELIIRNPRVVNGSQTLHSIRDAKDPEKKPRVMVKIIEISDNLDKDKMKARERRKEIIRKISIRSNMQNAVKKWNLVANDDFQNEVAQMFWNKRLYYERRQNEWKLKKENLRSINISQGPSLQWMMQLLSCYHFAEPNLGPHISQASLNKIFDEDPYSTIQKTDLETIYQLYLLGEIIKKTIRENSRGIDKIFYLRFIIVSILVRIVIESNIPQWGYSELTLLLEDPEGIHILKFTRVIKKVLNSTMQQYKKARRSQKEDIDILSYVKSKSMIYPLLEDVDWTECISIINKIKADS